MLSLRLFLVLSLALGHIESGRVMGTILEIDIAPELRLVARVRLIELLSFLYSFQLIPSASDGHCFSGSALVFNIQV